MTETDQVAADRPCDACGAEGGEVCRPMCIGEAAHLETGTIYRCCGATVGEAHNLSCETVPVAVVLDALTDLAQR